MGTYTSITGQSTIFAADKWTIPPTSTTTYLLFSVGNNSLASQDSNMQNELIVIEHSSVVVHL